MRNKFLKYDILKFFNDRTDYISVKEISNSLNISLQTFHSVMKTLTNLNILERKKVINEGNMHYEYKRKPLEQHKRLLYKLYTGGRK